MKLQYPLKDDSLKKWRTATEHYSLNESGTQDIKPEAKGGWFPVGANNFWHAGIHLDGERPFHAVADGSIVAYRLTSKPIQKGELTTFKEKTSGKEASKTIIEHPISTNFALTRHELKIPDNKSITFYVLYMHLQPVDEPLEWSKKSQVVFHRNKISVKNSDRLHGRGLYLYEEDGSTVITTMPQHAIVTCLHDGAFSKQLKIKRFSKVRFAFRDKVYNGFARLEGNIDQALNNSKGSQEVKIISDKDKASMNGLNLREQSYSFGDVIDLIPAGAELIFETPGDVADEGANLLSSNPPYKKIKGYLINNRMIAREGYVKVDGAYLDAEKYCDLTLDNVKQADIKIRKGEVIGWSSYDGVADNKKTVHMELFITDEDSFTNLKNYTNDCINQNPSLKAEDLLILNQEKLITETEVTGSYERVYFDCNTGKLISKADGEGKKLDISGMREGVKNDTSGPLLRRVVAKHRPEWVSLSPGANDKFFERLKGRPWEYNADKYGAYKKLFFEKLAFWHLLEDSETVQGDSRISKVQVKSKFPDEVYFFHPIKFIEHLKTLEPKIVIEAHNKKGKKTPYPKVFGYYNDQGELIHKGNLKSGKSIYSEYNLNQNGNYYVWSDESVGDGVEYLMGVAYRRITVSEKFNLPSIYMKLGIPDWQTVIKDHWELPVNSSTKNKAMEKYQTFNIEYLKSSFQIYDLVEVGDTFYIPLDPILPSTSLITLKNIPDLDSKGSVIKRLVNYELWWVRGWESGAIEQDFFKDNPDIHLPIGAGEIRGQFYSKVTFHNDSDTKQFEATYTYIIKDTTFMMNASLGVSFGLVSGCMSLPDDVTPQDIADSYKGEFEVSSASVGVGKWAFVNPVLFMGYPDPKYNMHYWSGGSIAAGGGRGGIPWPVEFAIFTTFYTLVSGSIKNIKWED